MKELDVEAYYIADGLPLRRHVINQQLTNRRHNGAYRETEIK